MGSSEAPLPHGLFLLGSPTVTYSRSPPVGAGLKSVTAVTALVVFLATTWAVDFRYTGLRTTTAWELGADSGQVGT